MVLPTKETMHLFRVESDLQDVLKPGLLGDLLRRRRTVADVEREVTKLRSVSDAGKRWIVDERCAWLGLGRHTGKPRFKLARHSRDKG